MKIGLVSPYALTFGGVQEHILNLRNQLVNFGHDVKIIAPYSKRTLVKNGIIFVGRGRTVRFWRTAAPIAIGFHHRLKRILKEENFDILHIHDPGVPTLPIFALFFSPTVNVVTFHLVRIPRFYYHLWDPYIWYCAKKVHGRIAVSKTTQDFYHLYFPGKSVIIPSGVDSKRFNPKIAPITKYKDGKMNILFVGRLEPRKEIGDLIKAFLLLRLKYSHLRLIIVGDGPLKKKLLRLSKGDQSIVFVSDVSASQLPRFYTTADIFCSPAGEGESFGIVLLEAMASGVPVVATSNDGYRQVIKNGQNGILTPVGDVEKLSRALAELIESSSKRKRLSKNGLSFVRNYSWEKIAKQIESFYFTTLGNVYSKPSKY